MYIPDIVQVLTTVPAADGNYKSALRGAAKEQIEEAIRRMEGVSGKKSRIEACEKELRKRERMKT